METLADKRASSAFLTTLRDEPSTTALAAAFTQKTTNANTLKVDGLAFAIARAEEMVRERNRTGSRPDIFQSLANPSDDASGPALYQPYIPTPIPPRASSTIPPAPIVVLNHQSFYHPPPPAMTSIAPARPRRNAFGAFAIAFIAPLVVVAMIIGGVSYAKARKAEHGSAVSTTTINNAELVVETPKPVSDLPATIVTKNEPPMLVVEVKSLKSVPASRNKRR